MQNYHNHKSYSNAFTSFKDSHVSYLDYARRAKALGHRVLTCMEHGYQGNFLKLWSLVQTKAFLKEFGDYPFKLVFGAEAYWVVDRHEPDDTNAHICLFARNESGRRQLTEILSIANEDGFYRVPRVDLELLHRLNPRDVLVTTACVSFWGKIPRETGQLVWTEDIDSIFRELHAHFGSSLYLEVQAHDTQWQRQVNLHALQLSRERGVPLIVGLDSHYITPEQEQERIWLREESGVKLEEDRGRDGIFEDYPDDETIRQRFARQGVLSPVQVDEAMRNTDVFLSFEDLHFSKEKKLPTIYPELTQQQRNQKYLDLVWESWEVYRKDIDQSEWPRYEAAIHEESDVVASTDMSDYFLIDYELVKRAKELGGVITPTGRGSGGSFFTNTLLGFSTLDRLSLPVTLYPSRFISKERLMAGSLPDLDLNVANPEIFAQAQEEIMGKGHAYPMIAYGTLKLKSAFRLFARAMGLPMATQNIVSEQLEEYETELKNAGDDEEIDVYDFVDENYREYVEGAKAYLGIVVSKSQAPCGYLIYNGDIRSEIGLIRVVSKTTKKSVLCTVIDGYTADEFGYVKNDLLKVDVVQVNYSAMKEAGLPVLTSKQIIELTRNDPATWDLLAKGYTVGINQCERAATRQKLMRYRPQNLTELSAFVAAIRPSFKSKVLAFLDRQHFDYGIGALDALLQTPEMDSSWILYQEQIMGVLGYAGFPMDQAYSIIKAIGKKHPEVVKPLRERFDEGFALRMAEDEQVPLEEARKRAEEVWQIIDDATSYGFNACLSGREIIFRAPNGKYSPTIGEMYRIRHDRTYAATTGHRNLHDKYARSGYGHALSLFEEGTIRKNRIVDIREAGVQMVYRLTTVTGREILCTANHKFPTDRGNQRLDELKVGDTLYCKGERNLKKFCSRFTSDGTPKNLPLKGQMGFQRIQNAATVVYLRCREAFLENHAPCERCGCSYSDDRYFELHHIDLDRTNNDPNNFMWLCNACHKRIHYAQGRTVHGTHGYQCLREKIADIQPVGEEMTYDVEMEAPAHNFVVASGIVTSNSHAVAVSLDALYGAYLKAHYPLQYYKTLLSICAEKKQKDRIAAIKAEMLAAFDIRLTHCRFGEDNREFAFHVHENTITDALQSIKGISKGCAIKLHAASQVSHASWIDFLLYNQRNGCLKADQLRTLVKLSYFEAFGGAKKLLRLFDEMESGENRIYKGLSEKSTILRREKLIQLEAELADEDFSELEKAAFEREFMSAPVSCFDVPGNYAMALEVNQRYSPRITLYNLRKGTTGVMKVKKDLYWMNPITDGQVIVVDDWTRRPRYRYAPSDSAKRSKPMPIPGQYDLWLTGYRHCSEKMFEEVSTCAV